MANKFLHIGINFAGASKTNELEPAILQICDDWLRYSANNWIIWTSRSANDCAIHLRAFLSPNDQFYIAKLDLSEHQGWMPKWIWDWINKPRVEQALQIPGTPFPPPNPFVPPLGTPNS